MKSELAMRRARVISRYLKICLRHFKRVNTNTNLWAHLGTTMAFSVGIDKGNKIQLILSRVFFGETKVKINVYPREAIL